MLTEVGCVFTTGASRATTREKRGREEGASGHGAKQRDETQLRDELSQMQPRGLKARACEMGVCEERIDATMDEDDVKGALIAVILEHHAQTKPNGLQQYLDLFVSKHKARETEEAAAAYRAAQAAIVEGDPLPTRPTRETSSKHRGVSWSKDKGKWLAQIRRNVVRQYLGYFADEEQAAAAVREWEASTVPVALPATHALPTSQVAESAQPRGIPSNPACPVHGGGAARMAPAPAAKPPVRPARLKSLWSR
jgi:hypothetical protein